MPHLRLRKLRLAKNLSQAQMADKLFKSQSAYCRLENGQTTLPAGLIPVICEILSVSPVDFWDDEINSPGNQPDSPT